MAIVDDSAQVPAELATLLQTDLASAWEEPSFRQALSSHCLTCSYRPCDDLQHHLSTVHSDSLDPLPAHHTQCECPSLGRCDGRLEAQALPDWCPVAVNIALLLRDGGLRSPGRVERTWRRWIGCRMYGATCSTNALDSRTTRRRARRSTKAKGKEKAKKPPPTRAP